MQFRLRTLLFVLALGPPVVLLPFWPLLVAWLVIVLMVLALAMMLEQATRPD
jgi:hypothetical protein